MALSLLLLAGTARAESILYASSTPVGGGAGTWEYTVLVTGLSEVQAGDFFVIVDFAGYVPASIVAPAGWSGAVELLTAPFATDTGTITPSGDSGSVVNLRFTRTGGTLATGLYSGFKADTTLPFVGSESIVSKDHSTITGESQGNSSPALVPSPGVPLPAAAWAGFALFGGLGLKKLRRREEVVSA
jgi:hypothetical protein